MSKFHSINRTIERVAIPRWPWRWLDSESPAVSNAYRVYLRFFWLVCLPTQAGLVLVLLLSAQFGFSESSFVPRFSVGLICVAAAFFVLPAFGLSRLAGPLLLVLRASPQPVGWRLRAFSFAIVAIAAISLLAAVALATLAIVSLSHYRTVA